MVTVETLEQLLDELKSMKLTVPEVIRQRVRINMNQQQPLIHRQHRRFPRWLASGVAVIPAVAVACGAVAYGARASVGRPNHPTAVNDQASVESYDYQKQLGFQPVLPTQAPLPLTQTMASKDLNTSGGDYRIFLANYGSGTDQYLTVMEGRSGHVEDRHIVRVDWRKRLIGDIHLEELVLPNGECQIVFTQRGLEYHLTAFKKSGISVTQLEQLCQRFSQPVTQPPDVTHVGTFGVQQAEKLLSFSVLPPKYIPQGFGQSEVRADVVIRGSYKWESFMYQLFGDKQALITVQELRTEGKEPNAPGAHNLSTAAVGQPRKLTIAGYSVSVLRHDAQYTSLSWVMQNGVHMSAEGGVDLATMTKVVDSMYRK